MPRQVKVTLYSVGSLRREGDWYVTECIGLPVVTQGKTDAEAMANLLEAVQLFVEECLARGTLEQVLLKYRWRPSVRPTSVVILPPVRPARYIEPLKES